MKQGHLTTWSGLTEDATNKNFKLKTDTAMVQMNKKRQNIHCTSKKGKITSDLDDATVTPAVTENNTQLVYAVVIDQCQLYTDLT
jgi:hypothetical protein